MSEASGKSPQDGAATKALKIRSGVFLVELLTLCASPVTLFGVLADAAHVLFELSGEWAMKQAHGKRPAWLKYVDVIVRLVMIGGAVFVGVISYQHRSGHEFSGGWPVVLILVLAVALITGLQIWAAVTVRPVKGAGFGRQFWHYVIDAASGPVIGAAGVLSVAGHTWADPVAGMVIAGLMVIAALVPEKKS